MTLFGSRTIHGRPAHLFRTLLPLLILLSIPAIAQQPERIADPERATERIEEASREGREDPTSERKRENPRAREEWFILQRAFPYDIIPEGARASGVRQVQTMERKLRDGAKDRSTTLAASTWRQIGPYNVGGRLRAVALDPVDPRTIYVGAAAGGVWKTRDGGTTWTTTFDKQSAMAIGALAVDPNNRNIVNAGTGEDMPGSTSYMGDGIFKSTDAGNTWSASGLSQVGAFCKMVVHKQRPNIVFAGGSRGQGGFYRSTDAGATWTRTYTGDVFDVTVNPANCDYVILSTSSTLYRSTDGGATFSRIASGTTGIPTSNANRITVAIAPSRPATVYALVARSDAQLGAEDAEIYKSLDSGSTWTLMQDFNNSWFFFGQGIYNNAIAVHPTNPNIVLALGIDIFRSTNGGQNWVNNTQVYELGFEVETAHPDYHMALFDPRSPGTVYVINDAGLYRSEDAGSSWLRVTSRLAISQFYKIDVDPTNQFRVYGGTQDNGNTGSLSASSSDPVPGWGQVTGGDGFFTAVDQNQPYYVYAENFNGNPLMRYDTRNGSIRYLETPFPADDPGAWSAPLAVSPKDGSTLFSARINLWKSANRGSTWTSIPAPSRTTISALGLSPHNISKMMIGKGGSGLYYSTDGGATWTQSKGIPARFSTSLHYDPVKDGRVYATFSGFGGRHVYRSEDDGANFTDISASLPDLPANTIFVDPQDNNHIFVGTDAGVFVSLDGGAIWLPFNDGLPLVPVSDLKIHKASRTLYAGTFGRSVFSVSIADPQGAPIVVYPSGGETIVTPGSLSIRWAGFTGAVRVMISYDGGKTFDTLNQSTPATSLDATLPLERNDNMVVRIEEIGTGRSAESRKFSLSAATNTTVVTGITVRVTALAVRRQDLWMTTTGNDTLYRSKLPLLVAKQPVLLKGISGRVRDLAYDAGSDRFYVLTTGAQPAPRIFVVDTTGNTRGEVTVPAGLDVTGIEITPQGLALVTPGSKGVIVYLDPTSGAETNRSNQFEDVTGEDRRSLAWDGSGLVQGVVDAAPTSSVSSELQRLEATISPRVNRTTRVVRTDGGTMEFVGLTFSAVGSDNATKVFYATDTSGKVFKIAMPDPSYVRGASQQVAARSAELAQVIPSPMRDRGEARVRLTRPERVTLGLWSADGVRVADLFDDELGAGETLLPFTLDAIASGVYYMTLTTASGERMTQPVCIVR